MSRPLLANRMQWLTTATALRIGLTTVILVYCIGLFSDLTGGNNRKSVYDGLIAEAGRRHAIPPSLIKAVIRQESGFRPWAAGRDGEIGLMQITRHAVSDYERVQRRRCPYNGMLRDPRLNIEVGSWYLSRAFSRWIEYRDVEALALAEYNAGRSKALEWAPEDKRESIEARVSFPGTREYIRTVLEYREEYIEKDRPL